MSALDLQVEVGHPLVRGALALYPLFGGAAVAPEYVPGPLASADLVVGEMADGPSVPHLTVTNGAGLPVLLVEGENLVGGWQNRTLNVSVLLGSATQATVPVSCVERGRWSGPRGGAKLAPSMAPAALRARKQRSVAAGVFAGAPDRHADQGDVWAAVDGYSRRLGVDAPTAALEDVHRARHADVRGMIAGSKPLDNQRGVAAAIGGRVVSVDLFDRASTLAAYWNSLVQGYALDAVALPSAVAPGRRAVVAAFEALGRARTRRVPGVGLGEEVHASGAGVTGSALVWDGACVHLAIHCPA